MFNPGEVVYLDINGDWLQTDAAATGTSTNMLGIALGSVPSNGILVRGYVVNQGAWSLNTGAPVYLSSGSLGGITNTAPSTAGDVVRIIGHAISADKIYFNPDNTWVEL